MSLEQRREQIEKLFRQYGKGVGSYVLARVGDADVAESITSNVFLIVVRRIEQCRTSPPAWLWSIVRTEIARHFRQRRPVSELEETYPDPGTTPPDVASNNELQARMRAALEHLTEEQHRIVYMKFFLDVPNTEIAENLGITATNVGVIVHRAIKRLRELMDDKNLRVSAAGIKTAAAETDSIGPASHNAAARRAGASGDRKLPFVFWLLIAISTFAPLTAQICPSFFSLPASSFQLLFRLP